MHYRVLRLIILPVLALNLVAPSLLVCAQSTSLDGKVFVVDSGDMGRPADGRGDLLTFRDGKFHSAACDRWGYGPAPYRAAQDGDRIRFESETLSEKDGRLVWKGVVEGGAVDGIQTYYRKPSFFRPNPQPIERWFKGKLKT